ncbi:MAG: GxxExxY protein [Gammaproteobacteria bacterium]|nr:GxxExxY protein [Gammaproteobacteria bacterium]
MALNKLSEIIIAAAIEVHRNIVPGLLESVYQKCLVYKLESKGFAVATEVNLPI